MENAERHVRVRVLTRGATVALVAALVAVIYLGGSPPRELECAVSCEGLTGVVCTLVVHPDDGSVWACQSGGSLTIWDPGSGSARTVRAGGSGRVAAAIADDCSAVAASGGDPAMTISDAAIDRWLGRFQTAGWRILAQAVRRDGGLVASSDLAGVDVWDMATGRRVGPRLDFAGPVRAALSRDGRSLAVGDRGGTIWLRDPTGAGRYRSFQAHTTPIASLAFSDDGPLLASSSRYDRTVRVWQTSTGRLLVEVDGRTNAASVALSPSGRSLATAGWDGLIRIWNVATGRLSDVAGKHGGPVTCMTFSPEGRSLACGGIGSIRWYPVGNHIEHETDGLGGQ